MTPTVQREIMNHFSHRYTQTPNHLLFLRTNNEREHLLSHTCTSTYTDPRTVTQSGQKLTYRLLSTSRKYSVGITLNPNDRSSLFRVRSSPNACLHYTTAASDFLATNPSRLVNERTREFRRHRRCMCVTDKQNDVLSLVFFVPSQKQISKRVV